jgi:hypothetical protein
MKQKAGWSPTISFGEIQIRKESMKTITRYISTFSAASLFSAGAALAQLPAHTPPSPTVPRANANANGSVTGQVNGSGHTAADPVANDFPSTARGSANATTRQEGLNNRTQADVDSHALNGGRTDRVSASAALDASQTARSIQSQSLENKNQLSADLNRRLDASSENITALKKQARSLDVQSQTEFKAALKDVETREKQLRKDLRSARNATTDTWNDTRSSIAADYASYADAVARAEAAAKPAANVDTSASARAAATPSP